MKKLFISIVFILSTLNLFCEDRNTWITIGYEQGFELFSYKKSRIHTEEHRQIISSGANISFYHFKSHRSFGLLLNTSVMIPTTEYYSPGFTSNILGFQTGVIFGFAFRRDFNQRLTLKGGFGLSTLFAHYEYLNIKETLLLIGTGGDVAFKITFSKGFFFDCGVKFIVNYLTFESFTSEETSSSFGFLKNMADNIIIRSHPYLGMGYSF